MSLFGGVEALVYRTIDTCLSFGKADQLSEVPTRRATKLPVSPHNSSMLIRMDSDGLARQGGILASANALDLLSSRVIDVASCNLQARWWKRTRDHRESLNVPLARDFQLIAALMYGGQLDLPMACSGTLKDDLYCLTVGATASNIAVLPRRLACRTLLRHRIDSEIVRFRRPMAQKPQTIAYLDGPVCFT